MKFTNTGRWCTGLSEEFFDGEDFDTKEEAVEFVREECGWGYVGEMVKVEFTPDDFDYEIGYSLSDILADELGDAAEGWELSEEDEAELLRRLGETMANFLNDRNLQPTCFKVINVEEVTE